MPCKTIAKCTPSLGEVSIWWTRMVEGILWPMRTGNCSFYLRDWVGDEVAETRNSLVQAAFDYDKNSSVSHLFWVDDDVLVFPGCLRELNHHDRDIVSGVYFDKMDGNLSQPLIFPFDGGTSPFRPNEIFEADHGMGLTLVKIDVYKRMRDELKLPLDKYGHPMWYHTSKDDNEITQDENGVKDMGHTEDLYFLENAHKLGYKPLVDCTKHAFGFHFDRNYEIKRNGHFEEVSVKQYAEWKGEKRSREIGYPNEQWNQWVAGEAIRWKTPQGEVVWE